MGDRYTLNLKCAYCNELNKDIWYAPTCNFFDFRCKKCDKMNFITNNFQVKKIGNITFEDVYASISSSSNIMSEKQIIQMAQDVYKRFKNEVL